MGMKRSAFEGGIFISENSVSPALCNRRNISSVTPCCLNSGYKGAILCAS